MLDKWIEKSCNSNICCKMMNGSVYLIMYTILATGHPDLLPTAGLLISTGWAWWHCAAVQSVQSIIQVKCRKHLAEWLFLCFDCSVYFSLQRCLVPRLTATGTAATRHQPGPATRCRAQTHADTAQSRAGVQPSRSFHNHGEGPFVWLKAPTCTFTFKSISRFYVLGPSP